ncbi:MAG: pyridoxamine 5'-phosphate oxidase family protein [Prolixibacteraceae bacterium]|jgi:predicted pyridoxine 5'-phosphate oxidase superfamily flavin-nucleotide-binding protein|nr:pyridoxamine 5'-phosphate oxidase family protein [Prolixibacteraceae bacterium]
MKKKMTEELRKEWENRNKAIVLTTVSAEGVPNSIYATCNALYNDDTILVANNFFDKTLKNIESIGKASVLFITNDDKSYQVKGSVKHLISGAEFDDMKSWNPEKLPGHGVAVIDIEEVFSGAEKLL